MATLSQTRGRIANGTIDRCTVTSEQTHPLGSVQLSWLDDGTLRVVWPNTPDLVVSKIDLDGQSGRHLVEVQVSKPSQRKKS